MNKVLLLILDGWGIAQPWGGNAISVAKTPYFDYLWRYFPHTELAASGIDVGLPGHEMGNSEVGHLNIGAGKIVKQDILNVNDAIKSGDINTNKVLVQAMERVKDTSGNLHLMGLLSDGGVHAHTLHAIALLQLANKLGVRNVYFHIFTDGRDTSPMSAQLYISHLLKEINKLKTGAIATVSGRYWGMDRNNKWQRIDTVYRALTEGVGQTASSALGAVSAAYGRGETDEFIKPTIVLNNGQKPPVVKDGDSIIFWNFRSDRARQLSQAFLKPEIEGYKRQKVLKNLYFVTLIPYGYEKEIGIKPFTAFVPDKINVTLASMLANNKLSQFHIAETEKYPHVTYFLNGTVEQPYPLEDRMIIPSPKVATYDQMPEMSAPLVSKGIIDAISSKKYNVIIANYANADMVGHTGNFNAIVRACEVVDIQLRNVVEVARKNGVHTFVTADHGNAEEVISPIENTPSTEHTKNKVPFIAVPPDGDSCRYMLRTAGRLSDIAPTILALLGIEKPQEMTGCNLVAIKCNKSMVNDEKLDENK